MDGSSLDKIRMRIADGLAAREPHDKLWTAITAEYEGEVGSALQGNPEITHTLSDPSMDTAWINILLSIANALLPTLTGNDPMIRVFPRNEDQVTLSRGTQKALNYVWRQIEATPELRKVTLDTLLYGIGFTKTGWDASDEGASLATPSSTSLAGTNSRLSNEEREQLKASNLPMVEDASLPFIRRIAPWRMVLPPGVESLDDAPWLAEELILHEDDVRAIPFFNIPDDFRPDCVLNETANSVHSSQKAEYVRIFEYREWRRDEDGNRQRWISWVWWRGGKAAWTFAEMQDPDESPSWPYELLQFVTAPTTIYVSRICELGSVRDLVRRLNDEYHYIFKHHRRSTKRKLVISTSENEDDVREWLEDDADYSALLANSENAQLAVQIVPEAPPPSDTQLVLQSLNQLIYEVSGMDAIQRGAIPSSGTATAAAIANQSTQNRLSLRFNRLETHISRVARQCLGLMRQYMDGELVMRLTDNDDPEFLRFDPSELVGEFDVTVEAGSTMPKDPVSKQQSLINMISGVAQVTQGLTPAVQAGVLDPQVIRTFVEKVMAIYNESPESFDQPMGLALQQAIGGLRRDGGAAVPGAEAEAAPTTDQLPPGLGGLASQ